MAQNLPAPCYQVYAASVLANLPFRQADLATRGLIHTMQLECWVNHRLPCSPAALAKVLGFDTGEVAASLPAAMAFFKIEGDSIISPQLEDYRAHLNEIRDKQKAGGKKGADVTNKKKGRAVTPSGVDLQSYSTTPQVHPQVEPRVSSKAKHSTAQQSQNQPSERATMLVDDWARSYADAEEAIGFGAA